MAPTTELAPPAPVSTPASPHPVVAPGPPDRQAGARLARLPVLLLLLIAAVAGAWIWSRLHAGPLLAAAVKASGRIEGREVTLAPKEIQGRVARLLADEGQTVKKGQLLAELDARQLEAREASLAAVVANFDAQIAQARLDVRLAGKSSAASIAAAEAVVSAAKAHLIRAKAVQVNAAAEHDRQVKLFQASLATPRDVELSEMALKTSAADVDAAEKDLARAEADLALARASADTIALKQHQVQALQQSRRAAIAQLEEAGANLAERQILAPIDGTILSRPVEVGDVVTTGTPMFTMVDLDRLYVKVYIPEPDIPKLRLGDRAEVTVDGFPNRTFAARVSKIHDEAEFTPKNVETAEERLKLVFGVELAVSNPERLLKPGMPADCVVHWTASGSDGARHGS